jgi:hypothetical protein
MRVFILHILLVLGACITPLRADAFNPIIESPDHSFRVTQPWKTNGVVCRVEFEGKNRHFILQPSKLDWVPQTYISPDSHFILRIQKTGSGDNTLFLYSVTERKSVRKVKPAIAERIWKATDHLKGHNPEGFYRSGFEFVSWGENSILNLTMHGRDLAENHAFDLDDFPISCNLRTGDIIFPKPLPTGK